MTVQVDIGFVPLTDAANLIIASELGFDQDEGVDFLLHREKSWSNIRDKVSLGIYPMAHMLSPLAISMSLGIGPMSAGINVPIVLSRNGNTLTAGAELAERLVPHKNLFELGKAIERAFERPVRIGVPYPHSMHEILTRYWLRASGVDVHKNIEFTVAPPSMLMDVLNAGEIDAFMVGEPWGSLAVESGAHILMCGSDIWNAAPEKVLAVRRDWSSENPAVMQQVVRAIYRASLWCQDPTNVTALCEILSMSRYVDVPRDIISRAITGDIVQLRSGEKARPNDVIRLAGMNVSMPWKNESRWIANQASAVWGLSTRHAEALADDVFRPDMFRQSLAPLGVNTPESDESPESINSDPYVVDGIVGQVSVGFGRFFDK